MFVGEVIQLLQQLWFWVGYVTHPASFPKPLAAEKERMLLVRLAEGDKEARDQLIEHNLRLVAHIAKKYRGDGREMDDLVSIGTIGLIKGIDSFRAERGVNLATYAARCIENEILMNIRAAKRLKHEVHLEEPIGADGEGNVVTLMDMLSAPDDVIEQVGRRIDQERLRQLVDRCLAGREHRVILMRYGLEKGQEALPQREVAKLLGISRSYVSRIEKKALLQIAEALEGRINDESIHAVPPDHGCAPR